MSASNYVTDKCQQALRAFLRNQDLGAIPAAQVYAGIQNVNATGKPVTRMLPCVECVCQNADTVDEHFLNWLADAEVRIRTNANDTAEADHHAISAVVFNKLTTDSLAADLSAALDDFTCFLVNFKNQKWEVVEQSYQSVLSFQIHCAGSDIS